MSTLLKFKALGLSDDILKILERKGFEEPSPIQELAIPLLLNSQSDVIAQAQTGTGKTAAFGIPILENLRSNKGFIQALVMVPTRELAIQVAEEMNSLRVDKNLQIIPIYGGQSMQEQLRRLKKGGDIIVATPGRLIDHMRRRSIDLGKLAYVVLDEADEMLRMGFIDDIETILKACPTKRRTLLFSATMPKPILDITDKYMKDKKVIAVKKDPLTANLTEQIYFEVRRNDRFDALCRIIDFEDDFYAVVFCRTKLDVDDLAKQLLSRGYTVEALHGDVSQNIRETRLKRFKDRKANILVATDVAARGIDVNNLSHVINFSLPQSAETYVHRIGRTGRAGKQGVAITFVTPQEYRSLVQIMRLTKTDIRKAQLPKTQDIFRNKVKRIKQNLDAIIGAGVKKNYQDLAKELLGKEEPLVILGAFLQETFQSEFDEAPIREVSSSEHAPRETGSKRPNPRKSSIKGSSSRDFAPREFRDSAVVDKSGTTRLFVALGKKDQMNPKKLVQLLTQRGDIKEYKIKDIEVFDTFSFVTVPFREAEFILNASHKEAKVKGKRQLIEKAK